MAGKIVNGDGEQDLCLKAGEYVFRPGDTATHFFVVEQGHVELAATAGPTGTSVPIAVLGAGDCLGENALLGVSRHTLSARAIDDCRLLKIDAATLVEIIQARPQVALHLLWRLGRRSLESVRSALGAAGKPEPAVTVQAAPAEPAWLEHALTTVSKRPPVRREPAQDDDATRFMAPPAGSTTRGTPGGGTQDDDATRFMAPPVMPPRLVHAESGREFPLPDRPEVLVGRADPSSTKRPDIELSAFDSKRSLSRAHARLLRRGTEFFIVEEPKVGNGTFVNGKRLKPGVETGLVDGDQVSFGLVAMVFHSR